MWHLYNSVLRSSGKDIVIKMVTNIQDGSVIHIRTNYDIHRADVTIVICRLSRLYDSDSTLIGMGSIIMDDAKSGVNARRSGFLSSLRAKIIFHMFYGRPAKVIRELTTGGKGRELPVKQFRMGDRACKEM